jgi:hypothetical protein
MATLPERWKLGLGRFSIEHLWCLTALVGIFVFVNTHPIRPHDFWWHMQVGREIMATGQIPTTDTFSFTVPGKPYHSYAMFWLMESALYILYSIGGPALVIFVQGLVITAAYSLLLWLCWQLAHSGRVATLCTLFAAALGINDWNVRPQTIAFLLGVLILWAIYKYRSTLHWRWLAAIPASMLVWANSHPTFFIGLAVVGLWLADESWQVLHAWLSGHGQASIKRLLSPGLMLVASALTCLANPQGLGIITYLDSMSQNSVIQNLVLEWTPPSFNSLDGSLFLIGLLLSATVLTLSARRPTLPQLLTFLAFAILGLKTSRGIVWFGIVMAPVLADHLPSLAEQGRQLLGQTGRPKDQKELPKSAQLTINYLFAGLILIGALVSLPWFKNRLPLPAAKAGLISEETPIEATDLLLREHLPGPLFHAQAFGSYLIWAAQPTYPVFVDPRIELYPSNIWLDYLAISAAQCGWEQRLDQYGINTLMLSPLEQPALVTAASTSPDWRLVYQDSSAVLFVRQTRR